MGSLFFSGLLMGKKKPKIPPSLLVLCSYCYLVADELFSAVASGQHWQFLCRRYLFLDGYSNSHLLDRYVSLIFNTVISVVSLGCVILQMTDSVCKLFLDLVRNHGPIFSSQLFPLVMNSIICIPLT